MGIGAAVFFLGAINVFAASRDFLVHVGELGSSMVKLTRAPGAPTLQAGAMTTFSAPAISPAYLGVGYIIGPRLGALNFAGGVFAWGLLVPLLAFFLGPQLAPSATGEGGWADVAGAIWFHIVRPIAVGGMMVGASFTLFRMRKNLGIGMKRAVADLKKSAAAHEATSRTQRDLSSKVVFGGLAVVFVCMIALYFYFAGVIGARGGGGGRHDRARILLRGGLRQPGGHDRLVEQPGLRPDAVHAGGRGAADGRDGAARQRGHRARCWAWRRWCASPRRWPARCCRT